MSLRNIQDLLSDGKTPLKDGSEHHLVARLFRLERWWNITLVLLKTYQDYINLVLKSCQVYSSVMSRMRCGTWKGGMVANIEDLEKMDASEIHARRLNAKEVLTTMNCEMFIFPVADGTGKNFWRRSTSENNHLDPGQPRQFEENQTSSLLQHHNKMTLWMMRKLEMISGLLQEFFFIAITWNIE